jgi:hypothetical protein
LTDEKFGLSDGRQDSVANVFRDDGSVVGQVLFEVTDLFLELEDLVLDQLKRKELKRS